jgi:hypothetical protein
MTWFENDKILRALPGYQFKTLEKSIAAACSRYRELPGAAGEKITVIAE